MRRKINIFDYILSIVLLLAVGTDAILAQNRAAKSSGKNAFDAGVSGVSDDAARFEELLIEAQLIFVDAIVADKSQDTLEAAYAFDLLFEAMAEVEQLPLIDELQRLELNRFLNAAISYYENDIRTLETVETSLTVSVLRDELSRFNPNMPADMIDVSGFDFAGDVRLPITHNDHVARIMQFFLSQGRASMQARLNRLTKYADLIGPIMDEEGVPRDMIYLALVESGLNPRAVSWKRAVGPWQFIGSTARRYDMKADYWKDDRRDLVKSTHAAARYLRDLYDEFGDWTLAMAAYNTGETRVRRAIKRHKTRDFWKLTTLPRQTRNYIPSIMAAFLIAHDSEKYGFEITPESPLVWDLVPVKQSLTFETLAIIAQTTADSIEYLNPELLRSATPPMEKDQPYQLKIPKGHASFFMANYDSIASKVGPVMATLRPTRHTVRRGESLYSISKRYGVTMNKLAQANGLRNWHKLRVGQRLDIPIPASLAATRAGESPAAKGMTKTIYTVRPGDSLGHISEAHEVGLSKLMAWNGIRSSSSNIRVGQKLIVWTYGTKPRKRQISKPKILVPIDMEMHIYIVRTNETLSEIAEAQGVGLSIIRAWNGIRPESNYLRVGQKLRIWRSKS